jgi:glycosyltransferase involved in cell wall biosynthesis
MVWLSRQLIIGYPSFEWLLGRPLVYDVDDAIYLSSGLANYQFKLTAERASAAVAGNDFLAEEVAKYCKNVSVIPTAVDVSRWRPLGALSVESVAESTEFVIGWCGTSSSFRYFFPLERDIKRFLIDHPSVKLYFMSDKFPFELKELAPNIRFFKWSIDTEVQFLQSIDVGLMPIADDMWSRGKCAYKSLLYAACGVPVIMTPTGVNSKLLNQAEIGFGPRTAADWYAALQSLFLDRGLGRKLGMNGISLVEKYYSTDVCAPKIISVFNQCK